MLPYRENLFRSFTFFAILAISMLLTVETRYLRPSDHGIDYQNDTTNVDSPEVRSFFNGDSKELPEAKNSSEPPWRSIGAPATTLRREDGSGKDRVRETLLIASLACGTVGVAFMVTAAVLFLFQQRQRSSSPVPVPMPSSSSNSCKEIVVRE